MLCLGPPSTLKVGESQGTKGRMRLLQRTIQVKGE